jgi:hypothetical protein
LDTVLLSNTALSQDALEHYAFQEQYPVQIDSLERLRQVTRAQCIFDHIGSEQELVRHDHGRLKQTFGRLLALEGAPPLAARHD